MEVQYNHKQFNNSKYANFSLIDKSISHIMDLLLYFKCILLCLTCKTMPIIKPFNLDYQTAFVLCKCNEEGKIMSFKEIMDLFLFKEEENDAIDNYIKCKKHNEAFKYYCENHEIHLCEKCYLSHKCHIKYVLNFQNLKYEYNIEEKIKYINKILLNLDESFILLKNLIFILFEQYNKFPNYNIIKNINNFYWSFFIKDGEKSQNENNQILISSKVLDFSNSHIIKGILIFHIFFNQLYRICSYNGRIIFLLLNLLLVSAGNHYRGCCNKYNSFHVLFTII